MTSNSNITENLARHGVFALLVGVTSDGELLSRPIGGDWGADIIEAIREMDKKYPGCKMKLFEENCNSWRRYFEGIVYREQLL